MRWLYEFDQVAFRAVHLGLHRASFDPIFLVLSYTGLGQVQGALALLMLLHPKTRRFGWPLFATVLVSGLVVAQVVKHLVERDRPSNLATTARQEDFFFSSFPSGHTTTAFGVAFMLLFLTMRTRQAWVGPVALVWAAMVGVSRVYRGIHWPTDAIGGAFAGLVGATIVYLVMTRLNGATRQSPDPASPVSADR